MIAGGTTCPHCGRINDQHSRRPGESPKTGDVSVCWGCAGIAIFTEDGVRLPAADEQAELEATPELSKVRAAITAAATPERAVGAVWGSS